MNTVKIIKTAAELSAALGDDFVLFVGSAVSGVASPKLAMVGDVVNGITLELSSKFSDNSYIQGLYAGYAKALVDGSYKNLLSRTKFEEFLWLLTQASHRTALNDLLNQLYTCGEDECGPNHKAIAALLRSGRCRACFTTNFDNAIERACPELEVYDEPGKYPDRLPEKGEKPALMKLHGSATMENCVAESVEILSALSDRTHRAIRNLLGSRKVLVLGYSGWGDIDISPHLSGTDATFFWANHVYPEQTPDWVDYLVISNLKFPVDSGPPNLLVELAGLTALAGEVFQSHREAASILKEWVEKTDLDAGGLIRSLFEWRRAWPILHLYHEEPVPGSLATRCRNYGWACIQLRAYQTALKVFSEAMEGDLMTTEEKFHIQLGKGFALWRLGRLDEAQETLKELAEKAIKEVGVEVSSSGQHAEGLLSEILRNYLEVSRDLLQWVPRKRRLQISEKWNLSPVSELLESLPKRSLGGWLLNRLVILHIEWLRGEKVAFEEVKGLYANSMNSSHFNVASAVVSLLLQISPYKGMKSWREAHRVLKETGINHYVLKNYQSLVGVVGATRFCRPFGKPFIRLFGYCRTWMQERNYRANMIQWSRWRKEWITTGKIKIVEE